MAQVDFVNYFSILFWFFLLFVIYYLINYSFLLPSIYTIINTRFYIYKQYINSIKIKFSSYIKNYTFYITLRNSYIVLIFFYKKYIYIL